MRLHCSFAISISISHVGRLLPPLLLLQHLVSSGAGNHFASKHKRGYVQGMTLPACSDDGIGLEVPDPSALAALLRDCCDKPDALEEGKRIHALIAKSGLDQDRFLSNHLVSMYGKCGGLEYAKAVFESMPRRNIISWTAMLRAFAQNEHPKRAFQLFDRMLKEGVKPNKFVFICLLNICSNTAALEKGKKVHACIKASGFELDVAVGNSLINMYGKCRSVEDACSVFDKMPERDVFTWTTMIDVCAKLGYSEKALAIFQQMQAKGIKPNKVTFVAILNACCNPAALAHGKMIHAYIRDCGIELDIVGWTALVNMYGKCGSSSEALKVFNGMPERNEVSWNTLISAYARSGRVKEVLNCFHRMKLAGIKPSRITFTTMLNACSTPADLSEGRLIYTHLLESKIQMDVVLGTALIRLFSKCGSIDDARQIFDGMPEKNVLTWTAMITAYTQCGKEKEAFDTYKEMQKEGVEPDKITFVSLLDACASLPSLEDGKLIHEAIIVRGCESDFVVATALLDMYAKCGSSKDAHMLFNVMPIRDIIVWNAMLSAYAQHGHGEAALQLCGYMQWDGIEPNEVTIVSIVSACSHAGLFEEGYHYFDAFENVNRLPTVESYRCIIDLLGRSGQLDKAEQLIWTSPFESDTSMWMALLSACKIYGDIERGKRAFEKVLELAPDKAAAYVTLSNIYAMDGKWGHVARVRESMAGRGIKKQPGNSSIGQ